MSIERSPLSSQSKYWCFTVNMTPRTFARKLSDVYASLNTKIAYICGQLEIASTGHEHFQGYVQLNRSNRLSWVRNNICNHAHWEIQRGTNEQARDYCTPDKVETERTWIPDTFVEFGKFIPGKNGKGARNDIAQYRDLIVGGASKRELIDSHPLMLAKYDRFYHTVRSVSKPTRVIDDFAVFLYVGDPGTGKTRKAYDEYPDLFEVPVSNGPLWMDGYDNHRVVLFDDFCGRGSKMSLDNVLKLFDRYIRQVPIKGGHTWWLPEIVIVTSNYHPRAWYNWKDREVSYRALARRFSEVWTFSYGQDPVEEDPHEYFMDRELWPYVDDGQYFGADDRQHF